MKLNKKGQEVESQVHWIFVLIAGALIIALFTTIVLKQKDSSEIKLQGKISQQLNAIFSGAQQSPGTTLVTPTPQITLEFTCNDLLVGPSAQRLGQNIIYANSKIEGREIITWTLPFSAPFKISNILYVTGPDVRYYLIDAGDANGLWNYLNGSSNDPRAPPSLPEELTRNFEVITPADISNLRNRNNQHVRFIFAGPTSPASVTYSNFDNSDISAIQIDGGEVIWFSKSTSDTVQESGRSAYYDFPMLYGAIFTFDSDSRLSFDGAPERYDCISNKLIDKLNLVGQIYYYKFNDLIAAEISDSQCVDNYIENSALQTLAGLNNSVVANWPGLNPVTITSAIDGAVNELQETNNRLQRLSCPLIY